VGTDSRATAMKRKRFEDDLLVCVAGGWRLGADKRRRRSFGGLADGRSMMRDRCGSAKWWPVSDKRKANDVAVVVRVLGPEITSPWNGVIQLATNCWTLEAAGG
jgi:hypothetical protein